MRPSRTLALTLAGTLASAAIGWALASRIRTPAQAAADKAPPTASLVTVAVEQRTLSLDVITRGTARYGSPRAVTLAATDLKGPARTVTRAATNGAALAAGDVALTVSGRPVFVLAGALPSYRDLVLGSTGADVAQLEQALVGLGLDPGPTDGILDEAAVRALTSLYQRAGWEPLGSTATQQQALQVARDTDNLAQERLALAQGTLETGRRGASAVDRHTAAADVLAATEARQQAETAAAGASAGAAAALADVTVAAAAVEGAAATVDAARAAVDVARATAAQDAAIAAAEVTTRQAALDAARAAAPVDPAAVAAAEAGLRTAQASAATTGALGAARVAQAGAERSRAEADRTRATAEHQRAVGAADAAQRGATATAAQLATADARVAEAKAFAAQVAGPTDTTSAARLVALAEEQAAQARAQLDRLQAAATFQLPADEVVYVAALPARVEAAAALGADPLAGPVMTVSSSEITIDGALALSDATLVTAGRPVRVDEAALRLSLEGVVSFVAARPGTDGADAQHVAFSVKPAQAPPSLLGASVRLTIPVTSSTADALVVPVSAVSLGADGTSRVEVADDEGGTRPVAVTPGLVADGLVEVRPISASLAAGDRVVVGVRTAATAALVSAVATTTSVVK